MRFLLIEDNADLARSVLERLALEGHGADHAPSLAAAAEALAGAAYDLILLDLSLPDGDGRAFLAHHRRASDTPVIVLTARAGLADRVGTLDLGADDYLAKPFDFTELMARTRAVLRRRGGAATTLRRFADLEFDPLGATLTVAGEARELRNRELRLFELFLEAPGRILSKERLLDRLFNYDDPPTDNAIEVYVGRLRKKLAGSTARIETVRGLGYRLAGA